MHRNEVQHGIGVVVPVEHQLLQQPQLLGAVIDTGRQAVKHRLDVSTLIGLAVARQLRTTHTRIGIEVEFAIGQIGQLGEPLTQGVKPG